MNHRFLVLATSACALAVSACASTPAYQKQQALLSDPRMKCAQLELIQKGYNVDPSIHKPGRILATRQFTGGDYLKAAITATVDTTDNSFEMWTRYIRPDQSAVQTLPAPSGRMMLDAMEVEKTCNVATAKSTGIR
ncbi:MAG: hypothetical protein ABJB74_01725 [Gemmatimonas sp.]